jgi:GntR family transcriptional regulator, carbon starvation induced regulator
MDNKIRSTPHHTLAQKCYEQLQSDIIDGTLKPGEKLKVEPMKQRFGIGQSPIREALSRLATSGLVTVENNKGFRVTNVSEANIRDTYTTFIRIENMALALAIEHGDAAWEAVIVAELHKLALIEQKNDSNSFSLWLQQNHDFHVALIAGCNSPALLEIRHMIYQKFDRYCRMAYPLIKDKLIINYADHQALVTAVLQRDIKKAQELMSNHINGALEDVIKKLTIQGSI